MRFVACCVLLGVALTAVQYANAEDQMVYAGKATSKFVNFPGLPTCMTGSVQNGDPAKTGSVILAKATSTCVVPWHWHTANEQLMVVSGSAKVAMKDGSPTTIRGGDYMSLPAKQAHHFTCLASCSLFIVSDAPFDIHYVDKDGKEISADEALKPKAKSMKKEMQDKEMKM